MKNLHVSHELMMRRWVMTEEFLIKIIGLIAGSSVLSVVIIILYLFNRPDKFEHWMRLFYQLIHHLSSNLPSVKKAIDRKLVAVSIQDTVNHICDQINEESPDILPHALKIEWIKSDTPDSFISKGRAVVRLKHYDNQDRNFVESTLLYLKHGFLPRTKNYLDKTLRQSSEYKVASRVFMARRDTGAYDYFFENEMMPAVKDDSRIQDDLQLLENLDGVGLFTRVFLSEVTVTGQKLLGTVPTDTVKRELRDFARFLETIATKAKYENVPLSFMGTKVKASVILVAKHETIDRHGIDPYTSRIQRLLREGYDSIYLAAWGVEFIKAVISIKGKIEHDMLTIIRRYDYPVYSTTKAILLVCQPKSSYLAQQKRLHDEVRQAFMDIVPEVKDGLVNIVCVSRVEKVGMKVAIKTVGPELGDPTRCCIGAGAQRIKQLKQRFPNEFIGLILWSDNLEEFVKGAISPLNPKYIDEIQIDDENLIVNVTVLSRESASKAIGKAGYNVRLASELTGYLINVKLPPSLAKAQSPEDELTEILKREIPEILNREIEVVRLARIKGVGSKVIVRWTVSDPVQKHRASEACYGYEHGNLQRIKEYLPGERIYFHDWYETPEDQISICLYPIKRHEIESVEVDDSSQLAVVTLNQGANKIVSSERDLNLALCEEVTGFKIEVIHL